MMIDYSAYKQFGSNKSSEAALHRMNFHMQDSMPSKTC
jgi:hypothetical protein